MLKERVTIYNNCKRKRKKEWKSKKNRINCTYFHIFGSLAERSRVMNVFFKIEQKLFHMKTYHLLPGGKKCQDPCTFGVILNGAADASA